MGPLITILVFVILGVGVYLLARRNNTEKPALAEEKAAVKEHLETTLNHLKEVDEVIKEDEKTEEKQRNLQLLRRKIASKKVALNNTLGKVEVEGQRNWDYRKLQAERTIEAAQDLLQNKLLQKQTD
jgi:monoamine oxidase